MMPGMPPMQVSASSSASAKGGDGAFGGSTSAIQQGDWNFNTGSGSVSTTPGSLLMMAVVAAGAWWLAKA